MQKGNILLRNGRLLDKSSGYDGKELLDILITDGRISGIGKDLTAPEGTKELDLEGAYAAPGFIDIHTHVFDAEGLLNGYRLGIPADMIGVMQGVTSVVDAGTAGPATMELFVKNTIERSRTRVFSAMHYATYGLMDPPEADDPSKFDLQTGIDAYEKYKEHIVAIKARASNSCVGQLGIKSIEAGKKLARAVGLPLLVHIGHMPPGIEELADLMDKGDIITHAFHGKDNNLLDLEGRSIPEFSQRARDRGVIFDIGHGKDSFNINTGKLAKELGWYPDTISTDLHTSSFHKPVQGLAETMSKFMALGYSLEDVVDKVTAKPAEYLSLDGLGALREGAWGDITVFNIEEGEYTFTDANKNQINGSEMIVPRYALVAGTVEMDSQDEFRQLCRALNTDPNYDGEYEYMVNMALAYLKENGVVFSPDFLPPFQNHIIALMERLRRGEHLDDMSDDFMDQFDPKALEITDGLLSRFGRGFGKPDNAERMLVAIHVQTCMEQNTEEESTGEKSMAKKVLVVIGDRMGKGQKVAAGVEAAGGEAYVIPGMAADMKLGDEMNSRNADLGISFCGSGGAGALMASNKYGWKSRYGMRSIDQGVTAVKEGVKVLGFGFMDVEELGRRIVETYYEVNGKPE